MDDSCKTSPARIPGTEDITRYVGGSHFDPDTLQINASAFDRTSKDTDGLSVNRTRLFDPDDERDRDELRRVMASRMKLGRTAVFAQLNVGDAINSLAEFEEDIFVIADPLPEIASASSNPAHALVCGLPFKGEAVGSLKSELAGDRLRAVITDHFPAVKES